MSGVEDVCSDSAEIQVQSEVLFKEPRQFKKVKRFHSNSFSHSGENGFSSHFDLDRDVEEALAPVLSGGVHISENIIPFGKNSKKSRNGTKIQTKKNGGGGKGIWCKPGVDYDDELILDENDPDYDSDSNGPIQLEKVDLVMSDDLFDETITSWIKEYFENGDIKEIMTNFIEISISSDQRRRLPYLAISSAVQCKSLQCELTSELLSALSGSVLSGQNIEDGFQFLLQELPDITLDAPGAPECVGRFIARAIADDVLPPKFVQRFKGMPEADQSSKCANQAIAKAENLLTITHAYIRLDSVWGVRGPEKPTRLLVKKIRLLLNEFLCSDDVDEVVNCLRELDAPHFHHELVYQAAMLVIERSTEEVCNRVLRLLGSLCQSAVVTVDQLEQGIYRVYREMPDIQIDVPAAYILLERFILMGTKANFITKKLIQDLPSKGRKRFVSEGDGGLLKGGGSLFP